jgi:ABC-type transporter Mla MlaB component
MELRFMSITSQISKNGDWEKLSLFGPINEDAEVHLPKLLQTLGAKVIVNFANVETVNSCGVRAWITFMRELEKGRSLIFEECTPEIVSQINMIPNFRGKADVQSVFGAYTCPSCGNHQKHLFVKGKNLPTVASDGGGDVACSKCQKPTEMDEIESEFFAWVES